MVWAWINGIPVFNGSVAIGTLGIGGPGTDTYFQHQSAPIPGVDVYGGALYLVDVTGASAVAFGSAGNADAWIVHEATGVLSLRHGSNAQEMRIYGRHDFSVAQVYERFFLRFEGGRFKLGTEHATNVGSPGQPYVAVDFCFSTEGLDKWVLEAVAGHFKPAFTGFFNVGASDAHVLGTYTNNIQGGYTKTLTESSATGFVTITIPNTSAVAGRVDYTVFAADATNAQAKSGQLFFSAAATNAGVVTNASVSDVNTLNPCTSGTLTNTMTATTAANAVTLLANAASSLTQTTLRIKYRVTLFGDDTTITAL